MCCVNINREKGVDMKGIDILNRTMVTDTCNWAYIIITISIVVLIISALSFIAFAAMEYFNIANVCLGFLILSIVVLFSFVIINPQTETGRYRYEVTIDDDVSFLDLQERYNVIEQNGRIWTLEDKEDKE